MALPLPGVVGDLITRMSFDALAAAVMPTPVTVLPSNPFDGQEVLYLADATNGVVWHLKYRKGSASAYKWEYVGGAPLVSQSLAGVTSASIATSTWSAIASAPSITVPLAGDYDFINVAGVQPNTAAATVATGVKVGATEPAINTNAAYQYMGTPAANVVLSHAERITGVAASTVLLQRYWQNGAAQTLGRTEAHLRVVPVRVG